MSHAVHIVSDWRDPLARVGLTDLTRLLANDPQTPPAPGRWEALLKPGLGGRQRWRWEPPADAGWATTVYVKRYGAPRWKEQWDRLWRQAPRHSRAWWELQQAEALAAAHVPVAAPIAVAEEMRGPWEVRSVVLLAAAPGEAFDRTWQRAVQAGAPVTRGLARHDIIVRLARFVSAFHQSGTCHRDLYLCHVFVELDPLGSRPPRFALIDLARTLRPRWRHMRWLIKDLAQVDSSARQLGASRADRLRFLQAYLGIHGTPPRLRWYAARIGRKSDWILRQIARRSARA